jgi:CO dehydrogenase/acetyl-CoA synthase gamma subunit (corrinoid Fe-S protein)
MELRTTNKIPTFCTTTNNVIATEMAFKENHVEEEVTGKVNHTARLDTITIESNLGDHDELSEIMKVTWNKLCISVKLVGLIQTCLNKAFSKVLIHKYFSETFPIRNGQKQGDALSPLLLHSALGYAIGRF